MSWSPFDSKGEKQTAESQQTPASHIYFLCETKTPLKELKTNKSTNKTPVDIEAPNQQNNQEQNDTATPHQNQAYLREVHKH